MLEPNFTPFPEIRTNRLLLRCVTMADAPEILAMRSNDAVMQFIDREKMKALEDAEAFIQLITTSLESNDGIHWAITLATESQKLIGLISFWRLIKKHYRAEIGYMLSPNYWRTGIMKEAILAVNDFGFKQIQLHSIEAHINPANLASAAILASTGYVREAYFKEDFCFKGQFIDTAIYSLLEK